VLDSSIPGEHFKHAFKPAADGNPLEHVFITPAVSTRGTGNPIDYYINKKDREDARDVFDDPNLFQNVNEDVRILIPYCTGNHWVTCEVKITKRGLNINTAIQLHDPYGEDGLCQLEDNLFRELKESIELRTLQKLQRAQIKASNQVSRFVSRRQERGDGNSCGVIVCEEINELASTGDIARRVPYSGDEIQTIRRRHLAELAQQDVNRQGLIERFSANHGPDDAKSEDLFTQVAASIKSSQLEFDEDKRLKSQRFLVENLGKLRKMNGVITSGFLGGSVLVFKNSSNVEAFRIVGNFEKLNIQCKDTKGAYIVQIQRLDAKGDLIPNCVDVLSYNNGKLENAVTIGDIAGSRSRVQNLLDQANGRGVVVKAVAEAAPASEKSWVQRIMGQRAVAPEAKLTHQ
jgi:hypothetical protein